MVVTCEQVWREISNYLEGDVDATLRSAMDAHFQTCKRCASVLEGTRNVIQLYGDERMIEVPAGYGRRLEKRLAQSARVRSKPWPTWSTWMVPLAAMALFAGGLTCREFGDGDTGFEIGTRAAWTWDSARYEGCCYNRCQTFPRAGVRRYP